MNKLLFLNIILCANMLSMEEESSKFEKKTEPNVPRKVNFIEALPTEIVEEILINLIKDSANIKEFYENIKIFKSLNQKLRSIAENPRIKQAILEKAKEFVNKEADSNKKLQYAIENNMAIWVDDYFKNNLKQ